MEDVVKASEKIHRFGEEKLLLALCGPTPAVLTETVWALAHETPAPYIPSRVIVFTTVVGREAIRQELFEDGQWERLRQALGVDGSQLRLGMNAEFIKVFASPDGGELEDLQTPEENAAVADFMLEHVRSFTENPDNQIVFSIAGGRKTMSVLAAQIMTLLGRPCDRICHVLVNSPFDSRDLKPRFYFPDPSIPCFRLPDGAEVGIDQARVELADIPFVPFREFFQNQFHRPPGRYMDMVRVLRGVSESFAQEKAKLEVDFAACEIKLNGRTLKLGRLPFLLYALMLYQLKTQGKRSWSLFEVIRMVYI
ncbi:MAG: TIGR02584 family CRISPR-associated protein, partial [Lentisphaerae bacterium]